MPKAPTSRAWPGPRQQLELECKPGREAAHGRDRPECALFGVHIICMFSEISALTTAAHNNNMQRGEREREREGEVKASGCRSDCCSLLLCVLLCVAVYCCVLCCVHFGYRTASKRQILRIRHVCPSSPTSTHAAAQTAAHKPLFACRQCSEHFSDLGPL